MATSRVPIKIQEGTFRPHHPARDALDIPAAVRHDGPNRDHSSRRDTVNATRRLRQSLRGHRQSRTNVVPRQHDRRRLTPASPAGQRIPRPRRTQPSTTRLLKPGRNKKRAAPTPRKTTAGRGPQTTSISVVPTIAPAAVLAMGEQAKHQPPLCNLRWRDFIRLSSLTEASQPFARYTSNPHQVFARNGAMVVYKAGHNGRPLSSRTTRGRQDEMDAERFRLQEKHHITVARKYPKTEFRNVEQTHP